MEEAMGILFKLAARTEIGTRHQWELEAISLDTMTFDSTL